MFCEYFTNNYNLIYFKEIISDLKIFVQLDVVKKFHSNIKKNILIFCVKPYNFILKQLFSVFFYFPKWRPNNLYSLYSSSILEHNVDKV